MADSRWVYSPIGGGKSAFGVREFYRELEQTERFCVFTLPVIFRDPPENKKHPEKPYFTAGEYCHENIKKPVDLMERCLWLEYDQAREFWRYLPKGKLTDADIEKYRLEVVVNEFPFGRFVGVKMPNKPHKLYKEVCDFSLRTDPDSPYYDAKEGHARGCFYQIDECHKHFPARFWAQLGPQAEDYTSELRKLNDDVDWYSQNVEKVDKNLRRNATVWVQIVNMSKTRLFMGVSIKDKFNVYGFDGPDMPSGSRKPDWTDSFYIGRGDRFEFTYLTMYGSSVRGGVSVEESRWKGNNPLIWVVAIILIFVGAHYLPIVVEGAVTKGVSGLTGGVQKGFEKGLGRVVSDPVKLGLAPSVSTSTMDGQKNAVSVVVGNNLSAGGNSTLGRLGVSRSMARRSFVPPADSITCTGYFQFPDGNVWVFLSNGMIAKSEYGEVQGYGRRFVQVFGDDAKIPVVDWRLSGSSSGGSGDGGLSQIGTRVKNQVIDIK